MAALQFIPTVTVVPATIPDMSAPTSVNCCSNNVGFNFSLPVDKNGQPLPEAYDTLLALLPAPLIERLKLSLNLSQAALSTSGPVQYTAHEEQTLTESIEDRKIVFIIDDSTESARKWPKVSAFKRYDPGPDCHLFVLCPA
jgi:hypothetical protein